MRKASNKWALVAVLLLLMVVGYYVYSTANPREPTSILMAVTVNYADGTSQTFYPQADKMTLIDASSGKTVTSVTTKMYVTALYEGTVQSFSISGESSFRLCDSNQVVIMDLGTRPTSASGTNLPNGQPYLVTSVTTTASMLESLYTGWQNGRQYYFRWSLTKPLTVTINFADGTTETRTATAPDLWWKFTYRSPSTFSSLSVSWGYEIT